MKLCLLPEKSIDGEEGAAYNRFRKKRHDSGDGKC